MNWYENIKRYYNNKPERLWSLEMVKNAVVKKKISKEQYQEITGETYVP